MDSFLSYKGANLAKMPRIPKEIGGMGMGVGNYSGFRITNSGFKVDGDPIRQSVNPSIPNPEFGMKLHFPDN